MLHSVHFKTIQWDTGSEKIVFPYNNHRACHTKHIFQSVENQKLSLKISIRKTNKQKMVTH